MRDLMLTNFLGTVARAWRGRLVILLMAGGLVAAALYMVPADVSISATATKSKNTLQVIPAGKQNAVIRIKGVVPGDVAVGSMTLKNAGKASKDLALGVQDLSDKLGIGGGRLSDKLVLIVDAVSAKTKRVKVYYRGPLSQFRTRRVGKLAGGSRRTYRVWIQFPQGGAPTPDPVTGLTDLRGDSAFMYAVTKWRFRFGSLKSLGISASADSSAGCRSRRHFPMYAKAPNGFVLRSAYATIAGKRIAATRLVVGKRSVRVPVDLRNRSAKRVVVKVVMRSTDGRRHVSTRVYRPCAKRKSSRSVKTRR